MEIIRPMQPSVFLVAFSLVVVGPSEKSRSDDSSKSPDAYVKEIQQWRTEHEEKFRSPTGWLALVGHYWLVDGDNSFGTLENARVQLPSIAGLTANGTFKLAKNKVSIQIDRGSQVLVNEKSIEDAILEIDSSQPETNGTDVIKVGDRLTLQLVRRNNRYAIRVRDSRSPLIVDFKGKPWRAVDPRYRVEAKFKRLEAPKSIMITNIKGDETESKLLGTLEFTLDQRTFNLDALADSPTEMFIIFRDKTCGKTSYGAGRFLDVPMPTEDDRVVLDFNKAYSPPCAYSPHTLCPLPPKQNQLDIPIEAGETYNSASPR